MGLGKLVPASFQCAWGLEEEDRMVAGYIESLESRIQELRGVVVDLDRQVTETRKDLERVETISGFSASGIGLTPVSMNALFDAVGRPDLKFF